MAGVLLSRSSHPTGLRCSSTTANATVHQSGAHVYPRSPVLLAGVCNVGRVSQVFMMWRPAGRLAMGPLPPTRLADRFLAATILAPRVLFAMVSPVNQGYFHPTLTRIKERDGHSDRYCACFQSQFTGFGSRRDGGDRLLQLSRDEPHCPGVGAMRLAPTPGHLAKSFPCSTERFPQASLTPAEP